MKIKTLIVEDDPLARKRIENLLQQDTKIEIVGRCKDGEEAVSGHHPDKSRTWYSWIFNCPRLTALKYSK